MGTLPQGILAGKPTGFAEWRGCSTNAPFVVFFAPQTIRPF